MTEPAVWVPMASGSMPAATAAAEPAEEPPGEWVSRRGLRVCDGFRKANSVVTVLPTMMPPARRVMATTGASLRGRWPA